MISVLVPSKGRPAMCRDMAASAIAKAGGEVEILVGVDTREMADYLGAVADPRVRVLSFGDGFSVSRIWNLLAESARGDLLLMGNDDQQYVTPGWDLGFEAAATFYPDGVFVAWCDDGINGGSHAAFPCVSRAWRDALGYFVPEHFAFFRHDTWIYDLGHRLGRLRYVPDVLVKHLHWTVGGVEDATTKLNRSSQQGVKDQQAWVATAHVRERDAEKLRALMREEVRA